MKELRGRVLCAAIRKHDPAGPALMKEFDNGHFGYCGVVVLDGRGERLSFTSVDRCDPNCTKDNVSRFPQLVAAKIEADLRRTESLQELERRWKKAPDDPLAFDRYLERIDESYGTAGLYAITGPVLEDAARSKAVRDVADVWGYEQRWEGGKPTPAFIAEGEALLARVAGTWAAGSLVRTLFYVQAELSDVPGRVTASLARLEKAAAAQADPAPLRNRIAEIARLRDEWIRETEEDLKEETREAVQAELRERLGRTK